MPEIPDEIDVENNKSDFPPEFEEPEPEEEEDEIEIKGKQKRKIKKIFEPPMRSVQEQPFSHLAVNIKNILSATQPRQCVKLYQFVKIFAKRLNEPAMVKKLNLLFQGVNVLGMDNKNYRIPLSVLQYVLDRDQMLGYSPTKTYQKKQITLAGIIIALDNTMEEIIDYYVQLCDEHNISLDQPTQPPSFSSAMADDLPDVGV